MAEGSPHTGLRNAQAIDRIDGRAAEADEPNACAAMPLELVLILRDAIEHAHYTAHQLSACVRGPARACTAITSRMDASGVYMRASGPSLQQHS